MDRLQFKLIPSDRINRYLQRILNLTYARFYFKGQIPKIKVVGIQTITGCNYSCPFCPANKSDKLYGGIGKSKYLKMKIDVFNKIMSDLRTIDYRGTISLFLMNEPLLDNRIVGLVAKAKSSNPYARLQIDTNGFLLNKELAEELFDAGLDLLVVNDYSKGHKIIKKIRSWGLRLPRTKCRLVKRSLGELQDARGHKITNRAGNVPGFVIPSVPVRLFCERPFNHMYITYNGKVVLCCQDWNFEGILGDAVKDGTLADIWRGNKYSYAREKLLKQDRNISVCDKCDFVGFEPQ